jgi:hypothetical protein
MGDFAFTVNIVAVVRVRAADESVARSVVPTVLGSPSTAEIARANQDNAASGAGAMVTDVHFRVEDGQITLVEVSEMASR